MIRALDNEEVFFFIAPVLADQAEKVKKALDAFWLVSTLIISSLIANLNVTCSGVCHVQTKHFTAG